MEEVLKKARRKKQRLSLLKAAVAMLAEIERLFDGQHPSCQFFSFGFADLGVGGHRHGAPNAAATFLYFGG
jgi:hypothetical protein